MGVLCINQVLDLLLLCAECVPCTVALLLYTGVENECRMAEDVSVLLTQHQRVVVERQDQGGVMVDPVPVPPRASGAPGFGPLGPPPLAKLDKRRRVFRLWRLPPLATLATPINKPSEHNLRCHPACQAHGRADVRCSRQV